MTQAAQLAQYGASSVGLALKNRIINGAMVIDQRNAGASVTPTNTQYTLDRWTSVLTQASKFTVQQNAGSVTPPAGFINYLGATSSSAYSVISTDAFGIRQIVEGLNVADLGWGTANAKTITISFWVRSSLTGTFGLGLGNSAFNRTYAASYTISAANTWEYKTVTIPGDTSGTWLTTNGIGIYLTFSLGYGSSYLGAPNVWGTGSYFMPTGSVSVVGTNGATWYVTGVQLEIGSTATSFDYRPYTTELQLCQRYFLRDVANSGIVTYMTGVIDSSTKVNRCYNRFPVAMRAAPTASYSGTPRIYDGSQAPDVTSISGNFSQVWGSALEITASGGGLTNGRPGVVIDSGVGASSFSYSAEL